jgi:hypothetical protein
MPPTGEYSDSEEDEDYPEQNVQATYAKAKFARIQPIIQQQTAEVEIEPRPSRRRAGQVITSTHQLSIDLVTDSLQNDKHISMPVLESDDEEMVHLILRYKMVALSNICTTSTLWLSR